MILLLLVQIKFLKNPKKLCTTYEMNEIVYSNFLYKEAYPFVNTTTSLTAQLLYIPQSQFVIKAI